MATYLEELNRARQLAGMQPLTEKVEDLDDKMQAFAKRIGATLKVGAHEYFFTGDTKAMAQVRDFFSSDQDDEEGDDPGTKRVVGKNRAKSAFKWEEENRGSDRD